MSQEAIIQLLLGLITGLVAAYTRLLVYQIQLEINTVKESLAMVRRQVDAVHDGVSPEVLEERVKAMAETMNRMNQTISALGAELSKRGDDMIHVMQMLADQRRAMQPPAGK